MKTPGGVLTNKNDTMKFLNSSLPSASNKYPPTTSTQTHLKCQASPFPFAVLFLTNALLSAHPDSPCHSVINLHLLRSCLIFLSHLGSHSARNPSVSYWQESRNCPQACSQRAQSKAFTAIAGNGARQAGDVLRVPLGSY